MCVRPIDKTYIDSLGKHSVQVGCGKCFECLQEYQNSWKVRLIHEFSYRKKAVFVTLTYNEDNVPYKKFWRKIDLETGEVKLLDTFEVGCEREPVRYNDGLCLKRDANGKVITGRDGYCRSVCKKDVQNWFKKSRIAYKRAKGKDADISYFCTSEYGPTTYRPHYHLLIFGLDAQDFHDFFYHKWTELGYVNYSPVLYDIDKSKSPVSVANYVSKYCCKAGFENPRVAKGLVEPTFHLISKGLGKNWLLENIKTFIPIKREVVPNKKYKYVVRSYPFVTNEEKDKIKVSFKDLDKVNKSEIKVHRLQTLNTYQNANGEKFVHRSSFNYPAQSKTYTRDFISKLSQNYKVAFYNPSQGKSFTYGLPRYYSSFIQTLDPCLYAQVKDYQRLYIENLHSEAVQKIAENEGCCLSDAYVIAFQREIDKKVFHNDSIRRNLADFYGRSQL